MTSNHVTSKVACRRTSQASCLTPVASHETIQRREIQFHIFALPYRTNTVVQILAFLDIEAGVENSDDDDDHDDIDTDCKYPQKHHLPSPI